MNATNWWALLVECSPPFCAFILCVLLFRIYDLERKIDLIGKFLATERVNVAISRIGKDGLLQKIFEGDLPINKDEENGTRPDGDT